MNNYIKKCSHEIPRVLPTKCVYRKINNEEELVEDFDKKLSANDFDKAMKKANFKMPTDVSLSGLIQ